MEIVERTKIKERKIVDLPRRQSKKVAFPFYRKGIFFGLSAGLGMAAILLMINMMADGIHTGWSLAKYGVLGSILGMAFYQYKQALPSGKTFKNGILLGAFISFIAVLTLIFMNTLITLSGIDGLMTTRYNLEASSLANTLIINGALLFEGLVFGMVFTFAWLQLLKDPRPAE